MKKDFTRRNHRLPETVKRTVARAGHLLLTAVLLCVALPALQPLNAQDVGNAGQAKGHKLYFGSFPRTYTGRIGSVVVPTTPYVLKPNTRDLDEDLKPYTGYFLVEPVTWRVLANDAEGILLLADQNLANWAYERTGTQSSWSDSDVRDSLRTRFLEGGTTLGGTKDYFSATERNAIAPSLLQNPQLGEDPDGIPTTDKVFLLSAADSTLFATAADRIARNTVYTASYTNTSHPNEPDIWLLRTHGTSFFPGFVMFVREESGYVDRYGIAKGQSYPIRPALRLARERFVMLSADKPAAVGSVGIPLTGSETDTMKLTLVDPSLQATITGVTAGSYIPHPAGTNLTSLSYSVTGAGTDEYISVLVEELGGGAVYYSKLAALPPGSSSNSLIVPFDGTAPYPAVPPGAYTVKIFREKVNTLPSEPDWASEPFTFTVGIASLPSSADITTEEGTTDDLSDGWQHVFYDDTVRFTGDPMPLLSVSGALPAGLTLEPDGRLHGTPSATGPFTFTVTAENGTQDSKTFTVNILPSAPPVITDPAAGLIDSVLRNIYVKVDTVEATGAPAPTYSVFSGKLPDGLSLDPVTGVIDGTPTKEEYATFTVLAANPLGNDYREYNIKVKLANNPTPPAFINLPPGDNLSRARVDIPYFYQLEAEGEPAPKFTMKAGSKLPAGLTLDPVTGVISGTPGKTSPALSPYNSLTVELNNGSGAPVEHTFHMEVIYTLHPPHLTLTPPAPAFAGSDPFSVTATFDVPVSDLQLSDIIVTHGTASNLAMTAPTGYPPRSAAWTFDVTPTLPLVSGAIIEAYIKEGAAKDEHNAFTYAKSDTAKITFLYDQPVVVFPIPFGTAYISDPGKLVFNITPNGTPPDDNVVYVNGAPATDATIGQAIEILRNGSPYDEWTASISGTQVTLSGVFGQGVYQVLVKPGVLGNNTGKFAAEVLYEFSVQISTNWYEGCLNSFTLTGYPADPADRSLAVTYAGLTGSLTGADGSPVTAVPLPAGQTEAAFAFRVLTLSDEQEGDSVSLIITDPLTSISQTYRISLYNQPRVEDVIFIAATTGYPGYFKLIKGGSPSLRRSFDAGQHWSSAWAPATGLELADAGGEIILREPDGCDEVKIPLDVSVSTAVQRTVFLPAGVANIVTSPAAGGHAVFSGGDFVFQVAMTGPLAGRKPAVTTDRRHVPDSVGVIVERNDDGTFTVRLRAVREPVHVSLEAGELLTGSDAVEETGVWSAGGQLYITAAATGQARIYTLAGTLLKSVAVEAGKTVRTALPPGFFVVKLENGRSHKVSGF
ncbi:MAG: putative Ig domain-containing protein [Tannerella sp.]|jgi:hypothetical protein|nr:putative Ig domain-containing protein [Tannerella sp.]